MRRARWISAVAAALLATLLPCETRAEPRDVLLVTLDTVRADVLEQLRARMLARSAAIGRRDGAPDVADEATRTMLDDLGY